MAKRRCHSPTKPGLGVELNENIIKKYSYEGTKPKVVLIGIIDKIIYGSKGCWKQNTYL